MTSDAFLHQKNAFKRTVYVPHCWGKRYHNQCVIILSKQIPQLMIISKWKTEFNYIFGSMWNKNYFFHTIIFLNDVKRPWDCWWVNSYVNSNFRPLGFKIFQKRASRSTLFLFRIGKSWVKTGCFNFLPIFSLICSLFCKTFESIDVNFSGHVWNTV